MKENDIKNAGKAITITTVLTLFIAVFEMVKYHAQAYPKDISLRIEECAAHFDVKSVQSFLQCSLHTEYCYAQRRFDSELVNQFPAIVAAQKSGVPQLWKNEE